MSSELACRCCGSAIEHTFAVPCWRAPDWATFTYGECGTCRSLSLVDAVDPAPFYRDYFAHRPRPSLAPSPMRRVAASVGEALVMPANLGAVWPSRALRRPEWLGWFAGSGLSRRSPILDVGAGAGSLLRELHRWGFRDLSGCDPYLDADINVADGVVVQAVELADLRRRDFGAIVFHHSLEHTDNPVAMLCAARQLLVGVGSRVVVAVPVAQGPVWEEYRDNWMALDAPLHRFVPTLAGLTHLADRAGFDVGRVCPSCPPYHLVGSELVARRVPPTQDASTVLSSQERVALQRRAHRLRTVERSPQVSMVLTPRAS